MPIARTKTLLLAGLAALAAVAPVGCAWRPLDEAPSARRYPAPTARRVELVNLTTRTQALNPCALSGEQFFTRATELCQAGKLARLGRLVARYPDVALESLRTLDPRQAQTVERQMIAQAYDRQFAANAAGGIGWAATLADMAARPQVHQSAFAARARARGLVEQGRFAPAAAALASIDGTLPPLLRAESLRLRGIALLLDDKPADAADAWRQARTLTGEDPGGAAELELLISIACRKSDQPIEAADAWTRAAATAGRVEDPILWERLMEVRPSQASWPAELAVAIEPPPAPPSSQPDASAAAWAERIESRLWRRIGQWRLARGESAAALLAYSRAEAESQSAAARGQARVGQARSLLAMGQESPATAILAVLAESGEPAVAGHALAVIGSMKLQQGNSDAALIALTEALARGGRARWPEFPQAQADLALAHLASGQEEAGLRLLHEAQQAFARDGRVADLRLSLLNESQYWTRAGQTGLARQASDRADQLDRL